MRIPVLVLLLATASVILASLHPVCAVKTLSGVKEVYPRVSGERTIVLATGSMRQVYPSTIGLEYIDSETYREYAGRVWAFTPLPEYRYAVLSKDVRLKNNPQIIHMDGNRIILTYLPSLSISARMDTVSWIIFTDVYDMITVHLYLTVTGRFDETPSPGLIDFTELYAEENSGLTYFTLEYRAEVLRYTGEEPPAVTSCSEWERLPDEEKKDGECFIIEGEYRLSVENLVFTVYELAVKTWSIFSVGYRPYNTSTTIVVAPYGYLGVTLVLRGPDDGYVLEGVLEYTPFGMVFSREFWIASNRTSYIEFLNVPLIPRNYSSVPLVLKLDLGYASAPVELTGRDRNLPGYVFVLGTPYTVVYRHPLRDRFIANTTITGYFIVNPPVDHRIEVRIYSEGAVESEYCSGRFTRYSIADPGRSLYFSDTVSYTLICRPGTEIEDLVGSSTRVNTTVSAGGFSTERSFTVKNIVLSPTTISYWLMLLFRSISTLMFAAAAASMVFYIANEAYGMLRGRYLVSPENAMHSVAAVLFMVLLFNIVLPLVYRMYSCLLPALLGSNIYAAGLRSICVSRTGDPWIAVAGLMGYSDSFVLALERDFQIYTSSTIIALYLMFFRTGLIIQGIIGLAVVLYIIRRSTSGFSLISGFLGILGSVVMIIIAMLIAIAGVAVLISLVKMVPLVVMTILISLAGLAALLVLIPLPRAVMYGVFIFSGVFFFLMITPLLFPVTYILYMTMMSTGLEYRARFTSFILNIMSTVYPIPFPEFYSLTVYILSASVSSILYLTGIVLAVTRVEWARGFGEALYTLVERARR